MKSRIDIAFAICKLWAICFFHSENPENQFWKWCHLNFISYFIIIYHRSLNWCSFFTAYHKVRPACCQIRKRSLSDFQCMLVIGQRCQRYYKWCPLGTSQWKNDISAGSADDQDTNMAEAFIFLPDFSKDGHFFFDIIPLLQFCYGNIFYRRFTVLRNRISLKKKSLGLWLVWVWKLTFSSFKIFSIWPFEKINFKVWNNFQLYFSFFWTFPSQNYV